MTIAFVASQEEIYASATPIDTLSFSVATGTRTHGVLVVKANIITSDGGGDLVTAVTFNGVALSFVVETSDTAPCTEIWRLFEFGGGTHNVVLSFTAAGGPPLTTGMKAIQVVVEWYDSDVALEAGNTNTAANGSTDPASITVDTTVTGELVTGSYATADNNVATATAGTLTQDWDQGGNCTGASYLIAGAAGTQTLTWDRNATGLSSPFNQAVACFREPAGGTTYNQSASGTLTPSGTVSRSTSTSKAGTLTPTGAVSKMTATSKAGTLTTSGTLTRMAGKVVGGTLTSAGTIARSVGKTVSGALAPTGAVNRAITKTFAGVLALAGALDAFLPTTATGPGTRIRRLARGVGQILSIGVGRVRAKSRQTPEADG